MYVFRRQSRPPVDRLHHIESRQSDIAVEVSLPLFQVAFLAAMVGPRVAAAAAQAALAALTQEDPTAQTGPTTDPSAPAPAPAPTAAPTALATPAANETPSSKPVADQGNGKAAAPEEPTDMVVDGAAEAPAAGEGDKGPMTKDATEKGPDAEPASAKAEGAVETAKAEGGEAKTEAMEVDAKETAPAATPAPVAAALPAAGTSWSCPLHRSRFFSWIRISGPGLDVTCRAPWTS